ncbi:MAG TPA: zinc-binding alcohol dehydrogenase [Stellaceae bacterium]|nr:zinc-binding alcohol dehydrogenase [Stellaceae bacterium]
MTGPNQGEIRASPLKSLDPGEVEVRTLVSGVSRGTESLVFAGRVPESQYQLMRCPFQEGEFPAPVKYGYAVVGMVEAGPESSLGKRVFCLHPHATRFIVPETAVIPVPDDVPSGRAVLAANLETALNGIWDGAVLPGDQVAVIGAGVVGSLIAWIAARIPGTWVELVDIDPSRAALARALGCRFAVPHQATREADRVFHASGSEAGLVTALRLARFEATIIEMSWYGDRPVTLPLGEAFHSRRLTLLSSQVGMVARARRRNRTHRNRLELALRFLADPVFDHLLSSETPFAEMPRLMGELTKGGGLCAVVTYT